MYQTPRRVSIPSTGQVSEGFRASVSSSLFPMAVRRSDEVQLEQGFLRALQNGQ
jgi:hypothetical protein